MSYIEVIDVIKLTNTVDESEGRSYQRASQMSEDAIKGTEFQRIASLM